MHKHDSKFGEVWGFQNSVSMIPYCIMEALGIPELSWEPLETDKAIRQLFGNALKYRSLENYQDLPQQVFRKCIAN